MANLTKTITNSINLFGGAPTDLWGSWNWNAFKWGEGTADLPTDSTHLISETLSESSAIPGVQAVHLISESISESSVATSEILEDGHGWDYVFVDNVINHQSLTVGTWVSGTTGALAWTSGVTGTTVWS